MSNEETSNNDSSVTDSTASVTINYDNKISTADADFISQEQHRIVQLNQYVPIVKLWVQEYLHDRMEKGMLADAISQSNFTMMNLINQLRVHLPTVLSGFQFNMGVAPPDYYQSDKDNSISSDSRILKKFNIFYTLYNGSFQVDDIGDFMFNYEHESEIPLKFSYLQTHVLNNIPPFTLSKDLYSFKKNPQPEIQLISGGRVGVTTPVGVNTEIYLKDLSKYPEIFMSCKVLADNLIAEKYEPVESYQARYARMHEFLQKWSDFLNANKEHECVHELKSDYNFLELISGYENNLNIRFMKAILLDSNYKEPDERILPTMISNYITLVAHYDKETDLFSIGFRFKHISDKPLLIKAFNETDQFSFIKTNLVEHMAYGGELNVALYEPKSDSGTDSDRDQDKIADIELKYLPFMDTIISEFESMIQMYNTKRKGDCESITL